MSKDINLAYEDRYDKTDAHSIEDYARQLEGKDFWYILHNSNVAGAEEEAINYTKKNYKGGLGNFVEKHFFGYEPNSDSSADFKEAGVELKVTPYEINTTAKKKKSNDDFNDNLRAGERLVLTMIPNTEPMEEDFYKSHVWEKCKLMLLMYYLRDKSLANKLDFTIDFVKLFTPSAEDLRIMENDYKIIVDKIKVGKAHELSEGDTMYLGACTKGATAAKSLAPQYYNPDVLAKRRAFSFKQGYMTQILRNFMANPKARLESIVKDQPISDFELFLMDRLQPYIGKTDVELAAMFGLSEKADYIYKDKDTKKAKGFWTTLVYRMLGIKSNRAEEFEKANITVKVARVEENDIIREHMSFPTYPIAQLLEETWEDSRLLDDFESNKFLFGVFQREHKDGPLVFRGAKLWNMPASDFEELGAGWQAVKDVFLNGIELNPEQQSKGIVVRNNLPSYKDNRITHMRPHASKSYHVINGKAYGSGAVKDSDLLPDGRRMTKQSFWLNSSYVFSIIKDLLQ